MSLKSSPEFRSAQKVIFLLASFYLCSVVQRLFLGLIMTYHYAMLSEISHLLDTWSMIRGTLLVSFLRPDLMYYSPNEYVWYGGGLLGVFFTIHGITATLWVCGSKVTKWIPVITGSVALIWVLIYIPIIGGLQSQYIIRPVLLLLMSGLGLLLGRLWVKWFGN
jgi:hypothetical protein